MAKHPDHGPSHRHRSGALLRDVSIWAGVASAVVAAVGAFIAFSQTNAAAEQNRAAQQQSLASVVIDITHQTLALAKAPTDQSITIGQARLADAEEGIALVDALHDHVPTIDDYEIGEAFQGSNEFQQALLSYSRAAKPGNDIHYRAVSLLSIASILYELGGATNDSRAYQDAQLSIRVQAEEPDLPRWVRDMDYAFGELRDAQYAGTIHCALSLQEIAAAKARIAADPSALTPVVQQALAGARQRTASCAS